jgi:formylglycine-generating enzyme required for sulfatase activity
MEKLLRYTTWAGVILILLGVASCNLRFLTPGGEENTNSPNNPAAPSNTDGAETILIPAGTFWMGSEATDTLADQDEAPRHEVTLNGFYLYTHEVTNAMYATCVAAGACNDVGVLENGPTSHYVDLMYADNPVVGVDWNMADDYCTWASGRLPTEAEWERAARGSDSLLYPWGGEYPACERANLLGCAVPPNTVEVGSYLLGNSPEGVWDMAGNVWEWVNDWYDEDFYFFSSAANPVGPYAPEDPDHPLKVVRGGGLYSEPAQLRGATRTGINPYRVYDDVGFRCVAEATPAVPGGYIPTDDRHERVPPVTPDGGGETVDDPDEMTPPWWIVEYFMTVSCPDEEGNLHIAVGVDTEPGTRFNLHVGGSDWFECVYDESLNLLTCVGQAPADFDTMETIYVYYQAFPPGMAGFYGYGREFDLPDDCSSTPPSPDRFSMDLDCPVDGLFTITFTYEPPIDWDTVRISGVDIPCVRISDSETRCTAPDLRVGDHYEFYLHGTDGGSGEYEWIPWVPVRMDCPAMVRYLDADPFCFEGHRTTQVMYGDGWPSVEGVLVEGVMLDCIGMASGVLICGDLTQPIGTEVEVQICFDGEGCISRWITVPECIDAEPVPAFVFEPYCYPPEAAAPAASIHYWPFDQHIVGATVGDTDISCSDWGGGWYVCPGVPGAIGETVDMTICLENGICVASPLTILNCNPPVDSGWWMTALGCYDETRIFFQVNTNLDWLVPGADYTYTATDGETTYTCTINPTEPGYLYCAGTRPVVPDPLELCLRRAGEAAPICRTFADFRSWVSDIPPCGAEEPPAPACTDYVERTPCQEAGCSWTKGPPDGLEHCYPP